MFITPVADINHEPCTAPGPASASPNVNGTLASLPCSRCLLLAHAHVTRLYDVCLPSIPSPPVSATQYKSRPPGLSLRLHFCSVQVVTNLNAIRALSESARTIINLVSPAIGSTAILIVAAADTLDTLKRQRWIGVISSYVQCQCMYVCAHPRDLDSTLEQTRTDGGVLPLPEHSFQFNLLFLFLFHSLESSV